MKENYTCLRAFILRILLNSDLDSLFKNIFKYLGKTYDLDFLVLMTVTIIIMSVILLLITTDRNSSFIF